jgi:hypothetical protein
MTVPTAEQAPTTARSSTPLRLLVVAALAGAAIALGIVAIIGAPRLLLHRQDLPLEQQYGHFAIGLAARVMGGTL